MDTSIRHISVDEFYPRWLVAGEKGEACKVIDVRSSEEYACGQIPSARLVPLNTLPGAAHDIERDEPVYLICQGGVRSLQALDYLKREHGLDNLVNINGGTMAWIKAGYPTEQAGAR